MGSGNGGRLISSIANIVTVGKSGASFTSIKAANDSITDNSSTKRYTIQVAPGVYVEDTPIQMKEFVTIEAVGIHSVVVQPLNEDTDLFLGARFAHLIGIVFDGVTGASNYAVRHLAEGELLVEDCVFRDCSNGVLLNNVNGGLEVFNCTGNTPVSTTVVLLQVSAGNMAVDNFKVRSSAEIDVIIHVAGATSFCTLTNIQSLSPNVTAGIFADDGCRISGYGVRFVAMYDGIIVQGDDTQVRLDSNQLFNLQNDGFRINNAGSGIELALFATTISGCAGYNFNILNPDSVTSGNGFTELERANIVDGAKLYAYLLDTFEGDEALHILGEIHTGTSMRPAEGVFGAGDSHTFEYVYTYNGSVFSDKTAIAKSTSGSTFSLDGVTAGNSLYIANRYPITFEGIKILIDTVADMGAGSGLFEYWNGSAWVEVNGCTILSSPGFLKYAKNYFDQSGSYHIKFNPYIRDEWAQNDPVGLGEDFYWLRYRITADITTSPVIQQIKIHTNRTEINTDGTIENHMDGRVYKKLSVDAVRPLEGNMQNASLYVDENVGVGLENNRFTTVGDLLGISFELPEDCDTSAPLIFVWKGKFATAGNVDFTVRTKIVKPGDPYTNSEPAPSGDTKTVTTGSITVAAANTREDFRVDVDISEAIPSRENGFGDEIWITLQYTVRGGGNFDYSKLSVNYLSDFAGRHIRQ